MVQPVIMQLSPILLPKLNGEVAMHSLSRWNLLGEQASPVTGRSEDRKHVADNDGGFAFAQSYSNTLFVLPDVDNTYQMMWNREENAWMVQESSATCDENGDESNRTKMCLETCNKTSTPRVNARAADNVARPPPGFSNPAWMAAQERIKKKEVSADGFEKDDSKELRKTKKKKASRRRLMGLMGEIQSSGMFGSFQKTFKKYGVKKVVKKVGGAVTKVGGVVGGAVAEVGDKVGDAVAKVGGATPAPAEGASEGASAEGASDGDESETPREPEGQCLHDTMCASKCCQFTNEAWPNQNDASAAGRCIDIKFAAEEKPCEKNSDCKQGYECKKEGGKEGEGGESGGKSEKSGKCKKDDDGDGGSDSGDGGGDDTKDQLLDIEVEKDGSKELRKAKKKKASRRRLMGLMGEIQSSGIFGSYQKTFEKHGVKKVGGAVANVAAGSESEGESDLSKVPHSTKDDTPCECDMQCESRKCYSGKCKALKEEENVEKDSQAYGGEDIKTKAAEKAKIMKDLWGARRDLKGLGGEGQSCLSKESRFLGTPACPVGQTCSSEGDQKDTCAPDWENQRYSFGMWKGMMLTPAERNSGEYQYKLHKGCITANECTARKKFMGITKGGKARSKESRSFYAAADPSTLPTSGGWWRSSETLLSAVTTKLPGWIARGGNIIDFKTPPNSISHKLMPGQYCGDKSTCERWCVDPTSIQGVYGEDLALFCWEITEPMKCSPDVLPDCRGELQCMDDANGIATCENPTSDKGKRLIALKESKKISFAEDPLVCASNCRSEQPCTGSNGNGIQKRTVFTQPAVGSDDTPSGPAGPAGPAAGEFRTIPTPLKDVSVFATGQCFECLLGADDHFRCPVHGRRMRLVDRTGALRGFAGMSKLKEPQHLDEALHLALYAAPDACFNHNPEKLGEPKGPFRMLRDKNHKVSLSFDLQVYYKCYQPLVSRACQAVTPPHT